MQREKKSVGLLHCVMKGNQRSHYMAHFTYFGIAELFIWGETELNQLDSLSSFTGLPLVSNDIKIWILHHYSKEENITEMQNAMMPKL